MNICGENEEVIEKVERCVDLEKQVWKRVDDVREARCVGWRLHIWILWIGN